MHALNKTANCFQLVACGCGMCEIGSLEAPIVAIFWRFQAANPGLQRTLDFALILMFRQKTYVAEIL